MIKKVIIIIILFSILLLLRNFNKEHFHEIEEPTISEPIFTQCSGELSENDSMTGCSRTIDFNPQPEKKKYILGRCLLNHTTEDNSFKDNVVEGCPRHQTLCQSSGCTISTKYFWKNLETLKSITDETIARQIDGNTLESTNYGGLLKNCPCNYELDKENEQHDKYIQWLDKIKESRDQ